MPENTGTEACSCFLPPARTRYPPPRCDSFSLSATLLRRVARYSLAADTNRQSATNHHGLRWVKADVRTLFATRPRRRRRLEHVQLRAAGRDFPGTTPLVCGTASGATSTSCSPPAAIRARSQMRCCRPERVRCLGEWKWTSPSGLACQIRDPARPGRAARRRLMTHRIPARSRYSTPLQAPQPLRGSHHRERC